MFDGFLQVGGVEVINNERVRGYAATIDCPFTLRDIPCDTLEPALAAIAEEDGAPAPMPYTYDNIIGSPWYDATVPDVSSRFLGVFATRVAGIYSSTRTAQVTEGITDGGTLGMQRRTTREVRVTGFLLAKGRDALEYGSRWLDAALDPDACGRHGEQCGTTDLSYLTACPPALEDFQGSSEVPQPDLETWNLVGTNLWTNPRAVAAGVGTWGAVTNGTASNITTFPGPVTSARRYTTTTAGAAARLWCPTLGLATPDNGAPVRVLVTVNASAPITGGFLAARANIAASTGEVRLNWSLPGNTIPAGVSVIEAWGNSFAGAATATSGFVIGGIPPSVGATLDVTEILVEELAGPGAVYFDGSTADTATDRFGWTGAVDGSTSTHEHMTLVPQPPVRVPDYPDPQAAWLAAIDEMRRYLHNVACVSGPNEGSEIDLYEWWMLEVEFVLVAGRPYVYSLTTPVVLPTTPSTVIDDIPKNLIPYPSAELPAAAAVVVARNYSTNPSVEVNATGWSASVAVISGTAPGAAFTSARVNEIAANRAWSFKGQIAAVPAATSGKSRITIQQDVTPTSLTGVRVSVNIWGAALRLAGTSPGTSIDALSGTAQWMDAANAAVGAPIPLGTATPEQFGGTPFSVSRLLPPAGATKIRVWIDADVTWTTGSDVRVYADALAVTVP